MAFERIVGELLSARGTLDAVCQVVGDVQDELKYQDVNDLERIAQRLARRLGMAETTLDELLHLLREDQDHGEPGG